MDNKANSCVKKLCESDWSASPSCPIETRLFKFLSIFITPFVVIFPSQNSFESPLQTGKHSDPKIQQWVRANKQMSTRMIPILLRPTATTPQGWNTAVVWCFSVSRSWSEWISTQYVVVSQMAPIHCVSSIVFTDDGRGDSGVQRVPFPSRRPKEHTKKNLWQYQCSDSFEHCSKNEGQAADLERGESPRLYGRAQCASMFILVWENGNRSKSRRKRPNYGNWTRP